MPTSPGPGPLSILALVKATFHFHHQRVGGSAVRHQRQSENAVITTSRHQVCLHSPHTPEGCVGQQNTIEKTRRPRLFAAIIASIHNS